MPSSVFTTRDLWADFLANQRKKSGKWYYWLALLLISFFVKSVLRKSNHSTYELNEDHLKVILDSIHKNDSRFIKLNEKFIHSKDS